VVDLGKEGDAQTNFARPALSEPLAFFGGHAYGEKTYTNGADRDAIVAPKFQETMFQVMGGVCTLNFGWLNWGDVEIKALAEVLPLCRQLRQLQLHGKNSVGARGMIALADAIEALTSLEELRIDGYEAHHELLSACNLNGVEINNNFTPPLYLTRMVPTIPKSDDLWPALHLLRTHGLIGASEDAWILVDPEWLAGVEGGREVLIKEVLKVDKEEGRVVGLELSGKKWKGEALPVSVARLTALRKLTMADCESLKSVADLPESVTQIGELAFSGCASLASITLPASVTQIGELAFSGCASLASITLPASVTEIGWLAFSDCTSLASITLPASVTEIGHSAFLGCASLASITLPASVTQIGDGAFQGCTSLESITLPESVTEIGGSTFSGCASLASITIPASVTQIGEEAFYNCKSLASITLPESVTQIGRQAFSGCTSLASITLPESVTQIGGYAFEDCTSLESITIPESVTQIGYFAFVNCASLLSITIPSSTVVKPGAFSEHTQVTRA
jgi:hypothetical protein